MKWYIRLFNFLSNRHGKYAVVDIKKRVREAYGDMLDTEGAYSHKPDNEAAYATYRAITGATVQESWKYCKPLIREWEGKK